MSILLDCSACKSESTMQATKTPRFSTIVRFIGALIVIPSLLGVGLALLMFFATGQATMEVISTAKDSAATAGATLGAGIGFGVAVMIGFGSLIGSVVGWLLLMKKKVYKCSRCGFILERA